MSLADDTLHALLRRGEQARVRGSTRAIQTRYDTPDSPYWQQDYAQRNQCHQRLMQAERSGGVQLQWSRQGGDDKTVDIVRLHDLNALAGFLGRITQHDAVQAAAVQLAAWAPQHPRIGELLDAWRALKAPRGLGPTMAHDIADALKVLDALSTTGESEDQIMRVLSRRLFGDSKRIEALARPIDLLTTEQLAAPPRQQEEVFSSVGLLKEPQPFLVAGTGAVVLSDGASCPVVKPFVGLSNRHVARYDGAPAWVLLVENLTTFHLASRHPLAADGLIVFTAGMPSPRWCRALAALLDGIPADIPVYHWGDVDAGGFRIAAHIRHRCIHHHRFLPWLMDASELTDAVPSTAAKDTHSAMVRYARMAGWNDLADHLPALTLEQEGVAVCLPDSRR